jgi:hypothetical protein
VNGAVFKTVCETVRTGSGRFDSYTPPPTKTVGSGQWAAAENRKAVGSRQGETFLAFNRQSEIGNRQ